MPGLPLSRCWSHSVSCCSPNCANLVVSGFYEKYAGHAMSVLAPAIPGLAGLMAGMLTMIILRRLLPERKAPEAAFESTDNYTVELLVPSDNPYIAKRVGQLGLNNVAGGSLIELRHFDDAKMMSPVPDREPLMGGDHLPGHSTECRGERRTCLYQGAQQQCECHLYPHGLQ